MSYKFQVGTAALSGNVLQRLGTGLNSQYILQNDAGQTKVILKAGSKGSISGSGGLEFTTGSFSGRITAAEIGAYKAVGAIDFNNQAMTNVDINSGAIDGATVGAASQAAGAFTTLSASSTLDVVGVARFGPANLAQISAAGVISGSSLQVAGASALEGLITTNGGLTSKGAISGSSTLDVVGVSRFGGGNKAQISAAGVISGSGLQVAGTSALEGAITTNGGLTSKGAISGSSTLSIAGNVQLDGADDSQAFVAADFLYFRDGDDGRMKRDSFSDIMEVAAGTVAVTGIENTSGVLSLAIHSLNAEVIATGDKIAFSDAGDNGLHSETVDDLFTKGPALTTEAAITVADDYLLFLDGGASGDAKKEKWADIADLIAGAGITATNGVLSTDGGGAPNALTHKETMTEGFNYATGSKSAIVYLPHSGVTLGDKVRLKVQALGNGKVVQVQSKAGGGTTIDGLSSVNVSSQFGAVEFIYGISGSWFII